MLTLTEEQRRRVRWLIDGHLEVDSNPSDANWEKRWEAEYDKIASPQELFLFAAHSHASLEPQEWQRILANPFCDRGTALLIYWRNSPVRYNAYASRDEVPDVDRPRYDIVKEIESRFRHSTFSTSLVRFDPTNLRGLNFLKRYSEDELKRVPIEMRQPTPGEPVEPLW